MKYRLFSLLLAIVLFACDDNVSPLEAEDLLGTWRLSEVLADPGNGSGTYQPVNSDKTIEFFANGTFRASQNMCSAGNSDDLTNTGTFNPNDSTLMVTNCHYGASEEALKLNFELDGGNLYILFPCIEPCGEKYVKIKQSNNIPE